MNRRVTPVVIVLGVLLVFVGLIPLSGAGAPKQTNGGGSQSSGEYALVEFVDHPTGSYVGGIPGYGSTRPEPGHKLDLGSSAVVNYRGYLGSVRANFHSWLTSNAPQVTVVREYDLSFNGVAVELNGASMSTLGRGPQVATVTPSWLYKPSMDVSVPLIRAPEVWSELGVKPFAKRASLGDLPDIAVGVIDTGILDTHPFIASCRPAGSIAHDVFFSGTGTEPFGPTIFFDHGTHVSGTIGGCATDGPFSVSGSALTLHGDFGNAMSGVAPGVTLHDYNVFPGYGAGFIAFGGSAFSHDIIAAVEKAVADGMDVINLSLGGNVQGPHDTLAEAINAAVDAGTVAVIAAGNSGPGILTVESPGNAANAITAGASTNPHYLGITVTMAGATFGAAIGDFANFDPAITAPTSLTTPGDGCTTIGEDLSGKIALIDRGVCTFGTKIQNAQDRHALGVVIVNNVGGDPTAMGADGIHFPTIPAAMVSQADGAILKGAAGSTITVDGTTKAEIITPNADILAGFSSKGPTPYDFRLKPDVTAPGVNVLSSVFVLNEDGSYTPEYAFFQGTSMATPHTAGAAALLKARHPNWGPEEIKSALVNNADRTVTATSGLGPIARGGGRINVERAAQAPVTLDPVSVSFGVWTGRKDATSSMSVSFTNQGGGSLSCALSVVISEGSAGLVTVSPATLTLAAGATASATVALHGGTSLATGFYWGDVSANCGGTVLLGPWWTAVERTNGGLNGNQNSPASYFDPAYYGDPSFLVAGVWTG
jgi:minor extracellular serine protease Vpr